MLKPSIQYRVSLLTVMDVDVVGTYEYRHPAWVEGRTERCASLDIGPPTEGYIERSVVRSRAARSRADGFVCTEHSINHLFD